MSYEELRLDRQYCFRFYTLSRLITKHYQPHLSRLGITYPQYLVLMVLWEQDDMAVNEIARRLVLETNTVTPLLQRMEKQKILVRRADRNDRRRVIVSLTPHGRELMEQARGIPSAMATLLSDEARQALLDDEKMARSVLDRMIEDLKADPTEPAHTL